MKLSTRRDIDLPCDAVFAGITDFARFQRQAQQRGIAVARQDDGTDPARARWRIGFDYRGRRREVDAAVATYAAPETLTIRTVLEGLLVEPAFGLMPLAPQRTRLFVAVDLTAQTFGARLLLQPLKLGKATLTRRLEARVAAFAADLEQRAASA